MSWADGPLRAISIETTGGDDETARIVAAALVFIGDTVPLDNVNLLIDPGVPVPAEAAIRHGITTERARAEGIPPSEALQIIANRIRGAWGCGNPLIGFGIVSTLTVLDREMRRHLGRGMAVEGPVIDPHIIDSATDHRDGQRSLHETCQYYNVRYGRPHDPEEDALAAARLAWKLARRHPAKIGRKPLPDLHRQQIEWAGQQAARRAKTGDDGQFADGIWPLRPSSSVDPRWNRAVLDAIHRKILSDWESKLRVDGPGPFRTELHIVNDTRTVDPYFTSIRCLPHQGGHNDAVLIAAMGCLAQAMSADRVVIAWEPGSLQLATWSRGMPLPARDGVYALKLLDVVVGIPIRLSTHPYTPPDRPPGSTPFSWGTAAVTDHPAEELHPVIEAMIGFWREPDPAPESEFRLRQSFRTMRCDITESPHPRR